MLHFVEGLFIPKMPLQFASTAGEFRTISGGADGTRRSLVSPAESSGTGTASGLEYTNNNTGKSSTWTVMCWMKWADSINSASIFASTTGAEQIWTGTTSDNKINARCYNNRQANSSNNAVTADTWHHLCVHFGINFESTKDVEVYIDNVSVASVSNGNAINELGEDNATYWVLQDDGADLDWDGRVFDFIAIEGSIVDPTSGNYSTASGGEWTNYTGSYGTNGFRLDGQNTGDAGWDTSGNGHHFTQSAGGGVTTLDASDIPPGA